MKKFLDRNFEKHDDYTEDDFEIMDLDEEYEEEYFESDEIEEDEEDIEYYEFDESDEEDIEYYESDEIDEEDAVYYEAEEIEDEDIEYYESEEMDENGIEYYEMDEYGDESEYEYDEYEESDSHGVTAVINRWIAFLSNMSGMDKLIAATGALVLVFALVAGSLFASAKAGESQLEAFAEVGTEVDDIGIIGESGLMALADSKKAQQEAAELAEEAEEETESVEKGTIEVTMNLSSMQQDLKIKFINKETSKLIASVPFEVEIVDADKKTYTLIDEDMDGIIYQKGITPGAYKVTMVKLKDYKDYNISTETQKVTVKDKIEYKKVDVEDEIKSESEVNAAVEDTKVQEQIESSNTDTVAFVESTKTEIGEGGYKEIDKAVITDPSTSARVQTDSFRNLGNIATNTISLKRGESTSVMTSLSGDFITWLSASESIASIDGNSTGNSNTITAHAAGTAVITASNGTDTETFQVTVTETQITLDKQSASVYIGQTVTIGASAAVTWTSSDNSIATVDGNGVVTGVKSGTAAITASANGVTASCMVTVLQSGTTISTASLSIKVGESSTLTATVNGADKNVTWTSSDASVATVDAGGKVTGVKAGNATITATANGISATCNVTVSATQPSAANNTTTALKDNEGRQVYIKNSSGEYVAAVYADYYKYDKFYIKEAAYKYTGWQTIDGSVYYYDANGNVVKGTQVIQGATYNFDATTGALVASSGILGIDVSKWNGTIDWNAVKNSGVNYVIIRCGYRGSTTGALIEDPKFKSNIKGATSAGLKVGVYFFSQATNEVEAVEEASMVLSLVSGYKLSYPVFLDVEPSGGRGDGISTETRTAVINAFCQTISNSGYSAGVYANKTWLNSKINTGSLASSYKIWLAQYAAAPSYGGRYHIWQYTSKGSVNGISGNVDMNLSYLGY